MGGEDQGTERLDAILASSDSRDGKLWAILTLLEEVLRLPAAARVGGDRVEVTHVDYGGDEVQGLTAEIADEAGVRSLPLAQVVFLNREPGSELVQAYTRWVRGRPADPARVAAASVRPEEGPIELVVLAVLPRTAKCRRLDDESDVVYRPSDRELLVPGTLITIHPKQREGRLEGPIESTRIDPTRLGLVPLALTPAEDDDGAFALDSPPSPEQLEEAELLADGGDPREARRLLLELLAEEPQLLEAHAALGALALTSSPETALAHYAVGAAIGDMSIPDPFEGLVPWELPGNRGYLACLYGCARALHRLGRDVDARRPLERLLALDPDDHLGGTQLLVAVGGRKQL
ncbi:MAG: hypothetical protein EP329_13105 [Deltaproteobacteria bacterium]|nr:MAG: hypothetical protein EP329_13105 [Deltaproteobacteria bacterium]